MKKQSKKKSVISGLDDYWRQKMQFIRQMRRALETTAFIEFYCPKCITEELITRIRDGDLDWVKSFNKQHTPRALEVYQREYNYPQDKRPKGNEE